MSTPKNFEPYIPAETTMREFTFRAVLTGAILGIIFGASSLYLVLKVGLTVSASIPVAVISLALFRGLSKLGVRDSTILENNITQTAGSAGESIAFGVGVTMPAILILGFDLELSRVMLVAVLGGLLGILMMIPLRKALIVKEHGILKYPEGTACAAVLKAGANAEDRAQASPSALVEMRAAEAAGLGASPGAKVIFGGFFVGLAYKVASVALRAWKETVGVVFGAPLKSGSLAIDATPELTGVGYIIGPRIASVTLAGGILSYLVLIPMIKFFGDGLASPLAPARKLIKDMTPGEIRGEYILYIGAGAVAAGGIISLVRALPTIWNGIKGSFRSAGGEAAASQGDVRTERDLPMKFVVIGCLVLLAAITMAAPLHMNLLGALLILIFGFLFVTVSSRLTGQIGSSSNPISGMTIATLLLTCLVFLLVGWTGGPYYVTALSVGAIVCIASSNGGTTSQDLKTGFLVGGTPKYMQYAILIGAFCSALVLGPILLKLNDGATVYVPAAKSAPEGLIAPAGEIGTVRQGLVGPQGRADTNTYRVWQQADPSGGASKKWLVDDTGRAVWYVDPGINGKEEKRPIGNEMQEVKKFDAPKAVLVSYIIKGILDQKLPWALVMLGVMIAVVMECCGLPSLVFAVGVYLPISSSAPLFVGGMTRWVVDRWWKKQPSHQNLNEEQFAAETDKSPGVLLSSGFIAGGAIAGIAIAFLAGGLEDTDTALEKFAQANNPAYAGPWANVLSLLPYVALVAFLYLVARERLLKPKVVKA